MFEIITDNFSTLGIVTLVVFVLWIIARLITRPGAPVEIISGDFTISQLNQFDGQIKPQTFLALKGVIYDVSGSWFYRKGAPYGKFAGHDASVNLAKMSHDDKMLDEWGKIALNAE
jgi:predicted heme/steroid binding protein